MKTSEKILRLLLLLSPVWLRRGVYAVLCRTFSGAITKLYDDIDEYKSVTRYRLAHNSQVCYLTEVIRDEVKKNGTQDVNAIKPYIGLQQTTSIRALLNKEKTSAGDSKITVIPFTLKTNTNVAVPDRSYRIITKSIYKDLSGIDFTVFIPKNIDKVALKRVIDRYKLASKRYNIIEL